MQIEFRGKASNNGEWIFGYLIKVQGNYHILSEDDMREDGHHVRQDSDRPTWVEPATIGQFTGLVDKDGKKIYTGDIVEYYYLDSYCVNPDCDYALRGYSSFIRKITHEVVYTDCVFGVNEGYNIVSLAYCGLTEDDIKELKELEEQDAYFDQNGYEINDSIVGIKVIGNIHDNPEIN